MPYCSVVIFIAIVKEEKKSKANRPWRPIGL
jgi:hypothetical protein